MKFYSLKKDSLKQKKNIISEQLLRFNGEKYTATLGVDQRIYFHDQQAVLMRIAKYSLKYGYIYHICRPIQQNTSVLIVDHTDGLQVGDSVELRNEYQSARSNFPCRYSCRIAAMHGKEITLTAALGVDAKRGREAGWFLASCHAVNLNYWQNWREMPSSSDTIWTCSSTTTEVAVELTLTMRVDSPKVDFNIRRLFHKDFFVWNEHLLFDKLPPLREVFKKNRQIAEYPFHRRYALDRQGAVWENDSGRGVYLYGHTSASSLEIESSDSLTRLVPVSKFTAAPHDFQHLSRSDITHYTSAYGGEDTQVVFDIDVNPDREIFGIRLDFYKNRPVKVRVESLTETCAWICVLDSDYGERDAAVLPFSRAVNTSKLRVFLGTLSPSDRISLRDVDILVGSGHFVCRVNLDDHRDHRFSRFMVPEQRHDAMGDLVLQQRSATFHHMGDGTTTFLSLYMGQIPTIRPRLMHLPGGTESLLVWTEHADRACLDSHRAVCFGRSDIANPNEATGGFVGHGIPVTKSVFYWNPHKKKCSRVSDSGVPALHDDEEFFSFCKMLAKRGIEICPHSTSLDNLSPDLSKKALQFFNKEFSSVTWIDHSARVVHANMSGQGMVSHSPYALAQSWKDAGIRYFWQFGSEDAAEHHWGSINLFHFRLGEWLHTPLYWRLPEKNVEFICWPTWRGGDLSVYTEEALDALSEEWGVCINHSYPPAIYEDLSRSEYVVKTPSGIYTSSLMFEDVLRRMARRRKNGKLYITTIRDILNYWLSLEMVDIIFNNKGDKVELVNRSKNIIRGFTVAIRGKLHDCFFDNSVKIKIIGCDTLITTDLSSYGKLGPLSLS